MHIPAYNEYTGASGFPLLSLTESLLSPPALSVLSLAFLIHMDLPQHLHESRVLTNEHIFKPKAYFEQRRDIQWPTMSITAMGCKKDLYLPHLSSSMLLSTGTGEEICPERAFCSFVYLFVLELMHSHQNGGACHLL